MDENGYIIIDPVGVDSSVIEFLITEIRQRTYELERIVSIMYDIQNQIVSSFEEFGNVYAIEITQDRVFITSDHAQMQSKLEFKSVLNDFEDYLALLKRS